MYIKKRVVALVLSIALMGSMIIGNPAKADNYDEQEAAIKQAQAEILAQAGSQPHGPEPGTRRNIRLYSPE